MLMVQNGMDLSFESGPDLPCSSSRWRMPRGSSTVMPN